MGNITLNQIYGWLTLFIAVVTTLGIFYRMVKKAIAKIYAPLDTLNIEIKELKCSFNVMQGGLRSQLRQSILKSSEDYMEKGYASLNQKEALTKAFEDYKANGGNSFVGDVVHQVMKLPTNKRKE